MILVYLVFFFLILRFSVTLFNFISRPLLQASPKSYRDLVSILIPARNEEANIGALLQSILVQDYTELEILVLDDDSSDDTFNICQKFAEHDARFRVIKGRPLPAGWLGKNYACHQLAEQAQGKYLLFLDADELVQPGLIQAAVHRMKMQKLDLLSLFTNQLMPSPGEKLVVPLMHFLLLNLLPLRLVRLSANPSFAAASGQFMLFDAADYARNQWHEQVKNKVVEDIEIMRLVKNTQGRGEALLANGFIYCRMYTGFNEAITGFSKNLLAGFAYSLPGLFLYLFLVLLGPLAMLLYLGLNLSLLALILILLSRLMISLLSGQSVFWNLLLHPFQIGVLLLVAVLSMQKYLTKSVTWKGRNIPSA
ncbi:MAG: glycosyltransferase [Sphingobacteriaceae bacterium]